jgi:hypothetical protein
MTTDKLAKEHTNNDVGQQVLTEHDQATMEEQKKHKDQHNVEYDEYTHYEIGSEVISISKTCYETCPCSHECKVNGKSMPWDAGETVRAFFDKLQVAIPKEVNAHLPDMDWDAKFMELTGL